VTIKPANGSACDLDRQNRSKAVPERLGTRKERENLFFTHRVQEKSNTDTVTRPEHEITRLTWMILNSPTKNRETHRTL